MNVFYGRGGSGGKGLVEVFSDLVEEVIEDSVCLGEALRGAVESVEGVVEEHGMGVSGRAFQRLRHVGPSRVDAIVDVVECRGVLRPRERPALCSGDKPVTVTL
ncbi:hypothetical protein ACIA78_33085 [Streptomyces xanthochromogenes]|uniref:hypothetical protein n=1 Tax=Streptomyces xanthochromogenes TaxID=67384 RepID=UPI0037A9749B